jgi:hypothetical protein
LKRKKRKKRKEKGKKKGRIRLEGENGSSTSTTPKYSTIHYNSADGIDFSKVDLTIQHI